MRLGLIDSQTWITVGFHATVFVAIVIVLVALQWLFDRRRR